MLVILRTAISQRTLTDHCWFEFINVITEIELQQRANFRQYLLTPMFHPLHRQYKSIMYENDLIKLTKTLPKTYLSAKSYCPRRAYMTPGVLYFCTYFSIDASLYV